MTVAADRRLFWGVVTGIVGLDLLTKLLAVASLSRVPRPVLGDWLTLQLVRNCGAAFGISVGACEVSRVVFSLLAVAALIVLGTMVRQTVPGDRLRLIALGLVCGGAVGNLIDRIRSTRGVVDFIDVGIGQNRWPTFNVADMAVTCGAIALAVVLWREGRQSEASSPSGRAHISS